MPAAIGLYPTQKSIIWTKYPHFLQQSLLILAGAVLLAVISQLSVPLKPVPLTFQSATVLLIGMAYGERMGSYVILVYILAGIVGFPVFANYSSGPAELAGPTAGYVLGFLPAAFLSGYLAQRGWASHIATSFLAACLGACIIFSLGLVVLAQWVGLKNAMILGLGPFIVSEIVKLAAVALFATQLWKK
jgi:biotin transport system substrate-specific component